MPRRRRRKDPTQPRIEPRRDRKREGLFTTAPHDPRKLKPVRIPLTIPVVLPVIPGSRRTQAKKISTARRRVKPALVQARPTLRAPVRKRADPRTTVAAALFEERVQQRKPRDMRRADYLELCARRKLRRRAIHAGGKANRPGGAPGPYRKRGPVIQCP